MNKPTSTTTCGPCSGHTEEEGGGANTFRFETGALPGAGEYTATVEYTEARPDLAAVLPRAALTLRSPSVNFQARWHPASALQCVQQLAPHT